MFWNWLHGPTAETVTMETVGLIKGTAKLTTDPDNIYGSEAAERMVKKIDTVLGNKRAPVDEEVRAFLTEARSYMAVLADTDSARITGWTGVPEAVVPTGQSNPIWEGKLAGFQNQMDAAADKMLEHFAGTGPKAKAPDAPTTRRAMR